MRILAIDPGDVHVGWAYDDGDVITAGEWTVPESIDGLTLMLTKDQVDEVVIEEWVLYEWEAQKQVWSHFESCQLIGAIKLLCRMFDIPWVEQGANIKKPTRRQLAARGIKQVAGSIHSSDAQLHLHYRKLRSRG